MQSRPKAGMGEFSMHTNLLGPHSYIGAIATMRRRMAAGVVSRWERARLMRRACVDRGTATAEYAIATLAACGFAGVLLALLRSSQVKGMLTGVIKRALSIG